MTVKAGMAAKRLRSFSRSLGSMGRFSLSSKDPLICLAPRFSRSMATETTFTPSTAEALSASFIHNKSDPVANFLGDATRQGTASSKTRYEVHGGHRKIRPQKGTGNARLGTRQSPMLVGGGKTFGPHPRDFSTKLPRKVYDLAWRTALSWRYRRGELIICEDGIEIEHAKAQFVRQIFQCHHWGREDGRSLIVTETLPPNLTQALKFSGDQGRVKTVSDVDVKDLLELGRIIIEKKALDRLLNEHQSDLVSKVKKVV